MIARRRTPRGSGFGKKGHFVDTTLAWLHQYRKLEIREEGSVTTSQALTDLARFLIYEHVLKS